MFITGTAEQNEVHVSVLYSKDAMVKVKDYGISW